jgi:hypothetical protein
MYCVIHILKISGHIKICNRSAKPEKWTYREGRTYLFGKTKTGWLDKKWLTHLDGLDSAKKTENLFQMYTQCAWALSMEYKRNRENFWNPYQCVFLCRWLDCMWHCLCRDVAQMTFKEYIVLKPWRWQKFLVLLGIPNEMLEKYFK